MQNVEDQKNSSKGLQTALRSLTRYALAQRHIRKQRAGRLNPRRSTQVSELGTLNAFLMNSSETEANLNSFYTAKLENIIQRVNSQHELIVSLQRSRPTYLLLESAKDSRKYDAQGRKGG
jgi:hypothetical protein